LPWPGPGQRPERTVPGRRQYRGSPRDGKQQIDASRPACESRPAEQLRFRLVSAAGVMRQLPASSRLGPPPPPVERRARSQAAGLRPALGRGRRRQIEHRPSRIGIRFGGVAASGPGRRMPPPGFRSLPPRTKSQQDVLGADVVVCCSWQRPHGGRASRTFFFLSREGVNGNMAAGRPPFPRCRTMTWILPPRPACQGTSPKRSRTWKPRAPPDSPRSPEPGNVLSADVVVLQSPGFGPGQVPRPCRAWLVNRSNMGTTV